MHYRPKWFCDTKSPMMPCIGIWTRWEFPLPTWCFFVRRLVWLLYFLLEQKSTHRLKEGLKTPQKTQGLWISRRSARTMSAPRGQAEPGSGFGVNERCVGSVDRYLMGSKYGHSFGNRQGSSNQNYIPPICAETQFFKPPRKADLPTKIPRCYPHQGSRRIGSASKRCVVPPRVWDFGVLIFLLGTGWVTNRCSIWLSKLQLLGVSTGAVAKDLKEYNGMSQEFWALLMPSLALCFQTSHEASIGGDSCTSSSPWTKIPYQCLTSIHGWPSNLGHQKTPRAGPSKNIKKIKPQFASKSFKKSQWKTWFLRFFFQGRKGAHFPLKHYDLVGLKC